MSLTETKGEERGKSRKIWGLIFWPAEFQVPWYIPMGLSTVQLEFQSGKELSTGERDLAALANGRLKPSGWVRATQGSPEWRDKGSVNWGRGNSICAGSVTYNARYWLQHRVPGGHAHAQWGEGRSCQQVAQRTLGEVVAEVQERGNQGQGMYCIIHAFSFNK